mmetsp:Transcript_65276/g.212600  ORF Transcript_65276/g.212600 Transcript_65276/m.212600 type:complete len:295 (+) Transcript_65276:161-1045(+)
MASPLSPARSQYEEQGDDVVFRCAACALCCGALAAAAAAFGCTNQVLTIFAPELSWLFLAPSLLIVVVGLVGLCGSRRVASTLFRMQLAVFLLVLAALLAAAGVFAYISASAAADWIDAGCDGHEATGLWKDAGRIEEKMKHVHEQYTVLKNGWTTCRSLNPLIYDLASCGLRAQCADGKRADSQPLFAFFQHLQLTFACGGFCTDQVPLFGLASIGETLERRSACAVKVADSVESLGHIFGGLAVAVAVPVGIIAMVLFWAVGRAPEAFDDYDDDYDDDGYEPQGPDKFMAPE